MSNEQLAVLLSNYHRQLGQIKKQLKDDLPEEFNIEKRDFLGNVYKSFDVLIPLDEFITQMEVDINQLNNQS